MQRQKAFIISNDPHVRVQVENAVQRSEALELIDAADPGRSMELRSEKSGTILFVDMDGIDPSSPSDLEKLKPFASVIAVSRTASHAVKAFEFGVKDFLLVPFTIDRFMKAIDRTLVGSGSRPHRSTDHVQILNKELHLKSGKQILSINSNQIELVQSMGNYTKLHLTNGHVLVNETMSHMQDLLPADAFVRVHRSYIISISSVLAVGGNRIEWTGGDLMVGASYKKEAFKKIHDRLNGMPRMREGNSTLK